jgi:Family of unknown function (DUF6411)
MLIAGVIAICILLFVLALLAPRLSRGPERATHKAFGAGGRGASKAPGKLGSWLSKPFSKSSRAAGKSASGGRRARAKLPL